MRALSNSRSLRLAAVLFLAVVLGSACETEGPGTEEMSETGFAALNPGDQWAVPLDELNRLLAAHPGAIILDVSPHDQQGMVPGAFALPVDRSPFEEKLLALDPEEPYLVFSAIRPDAERVTEMLVDAGFLSVVGLLAVPEMPADAEEPFGFGDWNPEELYVVPAD